MNNTTNKIKTINNGDTFDNNSIYCEGRLYNLNTHVLLPIRYDEDSGYIDYLNRNNIKKTGSMTTVIGY